LLAKRIAERIADANPVWLGRVPFDHGLEQNAAAVQGVLEGQPGELLAFEPQAPVYTLGLRARTPAGRLTLAATVRTCATRGIEVREVQRGGLGTLHAPGQVVLFVALPCSRHELRALVALLLGTAAEVAAELGVITRVDLTEAVGLWTPAGKLASLGLYEANGVVRHGLALNVFVPRELAADLVLCGSAATRLASLADLAPQGRSLTVAEIAHRLLERLRWPG